jgi:uncharacterized protein YbjT (DUF2867 family)
MKILVTGASGFIGVAAVTAMRAAGDIVIGYDRGDAKAPDPDIASLTEADWCKRLEVVDVVVNCAGIFGDSAAAKVDDVNHKAAARLFRACVQAGVQRVVQISALGVQDALSPFARSKLAAEQALTTLELDWVILRPSIVFGEDAKGGSGLLCGLAGLPVFLHDRAAGDLQIVQLEDVVATIVRLTRPDAPSRLILDLVGPERLSFAQTVRAIRSWLGRPSAFQVLMPGWIMSIGYAFGNLAGWLGWRTPVRLSARRELERGAVGDPGLWIEVTGIQPKGFRESLSARRPTAQDRTYAALYFLQPVMIVVTSLFFLATGIISLTIGYETGVKLLEQGGMGTLSGPSVIAGGLADVVVGLMIAWRGTFQTGLYLAIALSLFYFVLGTILLPELWRNPIGPMLKIFPLIVLNLVALAMVRDP